MSSVCSVVGEMLLALVIVRSSWWLIFWAVANISLHWVASLPLDFSSELSTGPQGEIEWRQRNGVDHCFWQARWAAFYLSPFRFLLCTSKQTGSQLTDANRRRVLAGCQRSCSCVLLCHSWPGAGTCVHISRGYQHRGEALTASPSPPPSCAQLTGTPVKLWGVLQEISWLAEAAEGAGDQGGQCLVGNQVPSKAGKVFCILY